MPLYTDKEIQARLEGSERLQRMVYVAFLRNLAHRVETGDKALSGWIVAVETYTEESTCITSALGMASADTASLANLLTIFAGEVLDSYYHDDEDERGASYGTPDVFKWLRGEIEAGRITFDEA